MSANPSSPGTGLWVGLALGGPLIAFGIAGAVHDSAQTHPGELARWIAGAAAVHDLVFAPVVLGASWLLARVTRRGAPRPLRWALATSAVLILFAWPFVRGYGRNPTVPSLLPRNYARGLVIFLIFVWAAAFATSLLTSRRRRDLERFSARSADRSRC